jgi:hypothetical protein
MARNLLILSLIFLLCGGGALVANIQPFALQTKHEAAPYVPACFLAPCLTSPAAACDCKNGQCPCEGRKPAPRSPSLYQQGKTLELQVSADVETAAAVRGTATVYRRITLRAFRNHRLARRHVQPGSGPDPAGGGAPATNVFRVCSFAPLG